MQTVHRFASRTLLPSAPAFSPDGRHAYFGARDGWITRFDLWSQRVDVEVRAGQQLLGLALSSDGRWLAAANAAPHSLVLFDVTLAPAKLFAGGTRDGLRSSAVASVHDAPARRSFIVALRDVGELWEISYDPRAEDIYEGLVHDFRMGEGLPMRGFHNARRTRLAEPLVDIGFDPDFIAALGTAAADPSGQVVNLDVRRRIATLPIAGRPGLSGATAFLWQQRPVLAVPNRLRGSVAVLDLKDWRLLREISTPGPGQAVRSHPRSPTVWVDASLSSEGSDTLTVIDRRSLEPLAPVREAGRRLGPVEFSHDGQRVLAGTLEANGLLIAWDASRLTEIGRLPMRGPVGVYRVGEHVAGRSGGLR